MAAEERGQPSNPFAELVLEEQVSAAPVASSATLDEREVALQRELGGAPARTGAEEPEGPGVFARAGTALKAFGRQAKDDPWGTAKMVATSIVTDPIESAEKLIAPGAEDGPEADAAMRRIAEQRYGAVPKGWKVEGVTGKERLHGGLQTAANALAPGIGGRGAGLIRNAFAGTLVGAAYNPNDPLVGAIIGGGVGAGGHVAVRGGGAAKRRIARAVDTDVSAGAFEAGGRGLLEELEPPPITRPNDRVANAQFAAALEEGTQFRTPAEIPRPEGFAPTAAPDVARRVNARRALGLEPTAVEEVRAPRAQRVEGLEQPGDMLDEAARAENAAALEAFNDAEFEKSRIEAIRSLTGIRRRPRGEKPGMAPDAPVDGPEVRPATPAPELQVEPTALPREPLPSYPEGFAMGGIEGRIPEGVTPPGRIRGGVDELPLERTPAPGKRFGREVPMHATARTDAGKLRNFQTVSDDGLVRELQSIRERMGDAARRAEYHRVWDDDISEMVTVATRGSDGVSEQAKALRNLEDWTRITGEIEAELKARGIDDNGINERAMKLQELDDILEREAIEESNARLAVDDAFGDGTDFDFGANAKPKAEVPPTPDARQPTPDAPAAPPEADLRPSERSILDDGARARAELYGVSPDEVVRLHRERAGLDPMGAKPKGPAPEPDPDAALVNIRKFGLTGKAEETLRRQVREAAPRAEPERQTVTFDDRRPIVDRLKTELNLDPKQIDPAIAKTLDANELQARMERVSENIQLMEVLSREAVRPELSADEVQRIAKAIDKLEGENQNFLETVLIGRSEKGRELGALRMVAQRSLDPAVWELRAMRMMPEGPLPDAVRSEVRRLARIAAEACGR